MVARVIQGQRNGEYGIWVSKPGVDVVSAPDDQMMLSTSRRNIQVVASGAILGTGGGTFQIAWPYPLGYNPVILAGGPRSTVSYVHTSGTTANLSFGGGTSFDLWTTNNRPNWWPNDVYWAVLNVPHQ